MCTVTYLPTKNGFIITSNRDEATARSASTLVTPELGEGVKLLYPRDPKSGGTWIAVKNTGELAVLLNGAFFNHQKKISYRESRGNILLKVISAKSPRQWFEDMDLQEIENFTLILYTATALLECRWDGAQKYIEEKDRDQPHIWSSATLYNPEVIQQRELWFSSWVEIQKEINQEKVVAFHQSGGDGSLANDLVMRRDNGISTVSISSAMISPLAVKFKHQNLKTGGTKNFHFPLKKTSIQEQLDSLCLVFAVVKTKLLSWEYWPMHVVYAPMYIYWCYLSLRAQTFFFFSAANPLRENAGFAMEKKSDSYAHLSKSHYPKTISVKPDTAITALKLMLDENSVSFPIIAKPDMGERGTGVKLIRSLADLASYHSKCNVDFLLQEYIDFPYEAGIFYCRHPRWEHGVITGIVGKELLSVVGDGQSNLETLILNSGRHLLQFRQLQRDYGSELYEVIPFGKRIVLSPYGNHCRGAKFIDQSARNSMRLTETIDQLCKQIPEFYYGRLDVKFNSWAELELGKNFSIIELNGAASEPTHIYDPKHSLLFAWKEIIRHWKLLYQISLANAKTKAIPLMTTAQGIEMLKEHARHVRKLSSIS